MHENTDVLKNGWNFQKEITLKMYKNAKKYKNAFQKKICNTYFNLSLRCLKCFVVYTVEDKLCKTTGTLPDHFGVYNLRESLNITACYFQLSRFLPLPCTVLCGKLFVRY